MPQIKIAFTRPLRQLNRTIIFSVRLCEERSNLNNKNRLLCWARTQSRKDSPIVEAVYYIILFALFLCQKLQPLHLQ